MWSFPSGLMASRCARVGAGEGRKGNAEACTSGECRRKGAGMRERRFPGEGEDSANGRRREGRAHCGIPERAEGQRGSLVQAAFRGSPAQAGAEGLFAERAFPQYGKEGGGSALCAVPRICRSALVVAGQGRRTVSFPHPAVPAGDALSGGFFSGGNGGRRMSATLRPAGCAGESFPSCGQGKGGRAMPKRAPLGNVGGKVPE